MTEKEDKQKETGGSPLSVSELISFLFEHLSEGQENEILGVFDEAQTIFLTDIYGRSNLTKIEEEIKLNIYESAYVRLLLDFGYIKTRRPEEKVEIKSVLYELLNKGLFCIAVDFVMSLSSEEKKMFVQDSDLLCFLNQNDGDGNIRYIKKTIYNQK